MMSLKDQHPAVHDAFQAGDFVVSRSDHAFSQLAVDQTIEQTINKDTKSKGGIVGFSLNKGAVQRWLLTSHERAAITQACREIIGMSSESGKGAIKERGKARMIVDENDVTRVQSILSSWGNPFSPSDADEITNLASGLTAPAKVEEDLAMAHDKGEEAAMSFIKQRLVGSDVHFFDPIKKLKLSTFNSAVKSSVRVSGKDVIIQADRDLFARLLVIAQTRDMDLREVMKYSLGPLPWSLASTDGSLCKTDKSKLLEALANEVEPAEDIPPTAALIIDGMAVLQAMKDIPATFEELGDAVFSSVVPQTSLARRIDFVTDTYPEISIKNLERAKRANHGAVRFKITGSGQKCPKQWNKFLSSGENKTNLTKFLLQEWSKNSYANRIGNRRIFFTAGKECFCLSVNSGRVICDEVPELYSNHEEADTKLILHAKHASENGEACIVIKSPDTDVVILACHFCSRIPARLLVLKKEKTRNVHLEISAIADAAGTQVCSALLGLHAFTGCDSTSSFAGRGKKSSLKMIKSNVVACQAMSLLGHTILRESIPFSECEGFVCKMYGKPNITDTNECRYILFCSKQAQSQNLPPCRDALEQHTMRANYQAAVWRRALEPITEVPSPVGHGWLIKEGLLDIEWMSLPPAPKALLELIICGCTGTCCTRHCTCHRHGLSCAELCQCGERCENPHNYHGDPEDSDDDEDEEETLV